MESVRKLVADIAATELPEGLDDGLIFDLNDVRAETIREGETYGGSRSESGWQSEGSAATERRPS